MTALSLSAQQPEQVALARTMLESGDARGAFDYLWRFIQDASFKNTSPKDRAAIYGSLGTLAHELGDYRVAEHGYRQAARLCESLSPMDVCAIAMSNNLAAIHLEYGDTDQARLEVQKYVDSDLVAQFGPTDREVLRRWSNRGSIEYAEKRPERAIPWHRMALNGWRDRQQLDSLEGIIARTDIGIALHAARQFREAELFLAGVLQSLKSQPTHIQSRYPLTLAYLGEAKGMLGQTESASSLFVAATEDAIRRFGPTHPVTGAILVRRGEFLMRSGSTAEGKKLRKRGGGILEAFRRAQGLNQSIDVRSLPP
ncbi:MAG: tetratricopeptide repeat protein [Acidobacteriota bacterium]